MTARDSVPLQRPFYFFVVLWGERFRDYFLEYCLPSLLAPGNIPALNRGRGSKFLIATRPDDWAAMTATPIFKRLAEYVEPVYIEIPPCPPEKSGCQHMGVGHKLASEIAYRDKAYGVVLTPDMVLSDGALSTVQRHALAGKQVVFCPASLRIMEEPFFAGLAELGATGDLAARARPLVLTGRQMVHIGLRSLHSTAHLYEWDAPHFADFPVACYWRVPGEDGIMMHCLSWAPILIDYAAVRAHDTNVLDTWTIDGDYVHGNFYHCRNVHIVQDSDEMLMLSWSPAQDRPIQLKAERIKSHAWLGDITKQGCLRSAFFSKTYDDLKRDIFPIAVYWHAAALNSNWNPTRIRANRLIRQAIKGYRQGPWGYLADAQATPLIYPHAIAGLATPTAFGGQWIAALVMRAVLRLYPVTVAFMAKYISVHVRTRYWSHLVWRLFWLTALTATGDTDARARLFRGLRIYFPPVLRALRLEGTARRLGLPPVWLP